MSPNRPRRPLVAAGALAAVLALAAGPALDAAIRLRETAAAWGLGFRHHDGSSGRRYLPETMGSGVVVFDYDLDGDPDVFFLDGGPLPGAEAEPFRSRLFRNDGGLFVDATEVSGLVVSGFGTGGTAGDVDGDGDPDLYLTSYGGSGLWINRGDGSFERSQAGGVLDGESWGCSAAFADPDGDGDLDLYVANYVDFAPTESTPCRQQGVEVYCHPGQYEGLPDRFYRNLGAGRFEEATAAAGLAVGARAGLGAAFGDLDGDGDLDLYVANDAEANFLFLNRGDGTFEESALLGGTAYGDTGSPEAGMGVALGDADGDGRLDIVVTNFELETNAFYKNVGDGLFVDARFAANLAEASLLSLAFGVAMADLDADGDLDLIFANGHILDNTEGFHPRSSYAQANQVFENLGAGRFREEREYGAASRRVSRGLATGDLDGDGDLDVVISNVDDVAEIYENLSSGGNGWLVVDLRSHGPNSQGVGARVVVAAAGRRLVREVRTGSSYLSQSEIRTHFGLGAAAVDSLEVRWPNRERQRLLGVPANHRLLIERLAAPR